MITPTRAIALYLPQYHPIPENDEWWGRGFTEWTNTAKAKPLFRSHYQPHVPSELGFYDLRVPETRADQAALAREHGIEAFCYYHYWFAGRRIIERPFAEVLSSGQPDFPFCLCWANQTWSGVWHGLTNRILIEQTYPGRDDHRRHFEALLPAFRDRRYVTVDGKPVFVVFRPKDIPDAKTTFDFWQEMAREAGLPGLFLVGDTDSPSWKPAEFGFDASVLNRLPPKRRDWVPWSQPRRKVVQKLSQMMGRPSIHAYSTLVDRVIPPPVAGVECYPCVIPNWDNTARSGVNGLVLQGSTPQLFREQVRRALACVQNMPDQHRIIFVKSWNEWAEGNHLEPDLKFGRAYLEVLRDELTAQGPAQPSTR